MLSLLLKELKSNEDEAVCLYVYVVPPSLPPSLSQSVGSAVHEIYNVHAF